MSARFASAALVTLFGAVMTAGCATVSHGTHQNVIVNSDPSGAQVFSGDKRLGVTPVVLNFWRGDGNVVLRFELDGFEAKEVPLKRSASAMMAADVALSVNPMAAQGMDHASDYPKFVALALAETLGIDLLSGGGFKFPNVVTATLKRSASGTR